MRYGKQDFYDVLKKALNAQYRRSIIVHDSIHSVFMQHVYENIQNIHGYGNLWCFDTNGFLCTNVPIKYKINDETDVGFFSIIFQLDNCFRVEFEIIMTKDTYEVIFHKLSNL